MSLKRTYPTDLSPADRAMEQRSRKTGNMREQGQEANTFQNLTPQHRQQDR